MHIKSLQEAESTTIPDHHCWPNAFVSATSTHPFMNITPFITSEKDTVKRSTCQCLRRIRVCYFISVIPFLYGAVFLPFFQMNLSIELCTPNLYLNVTYLSDSYTNFVIVTMQMNMSIKVHSTRTRLCNRFSIEMEKKRRTFFYRNIFHHLV